MFYKHLYFLSVLKLIIDMGWRACVWLMVVAIAVQAHGGSGAFPADSDCGVTKGCFSDCQSGCTYQVYMSLI